VLAAYDAGIRYYDTAPFYGHGMGEVRLGSVLRHYPRNAFTLSTKVGRVLVPAEAGAIEDHAYRDTLAYNPVFDLSPDGIRRSFASSLERLGLDRIDIALLHDPDDSFDEAIEHAFPTMIRMREEGLVTAIGAGMNQWEMLYELARRVDVDCFLLAGRYTLLDQSAAERLLPECENRGISILLGGPYNSGILAGGEHYNSEAAPPEMIAKRDRLAALCAEHDVPLKAAALQFPLRHPAVASVVAGARTATEVRENVAMMSADIPKSFWKALTEVIDA
jgi:D-threo-aldose 1-dehydrogenase